MTLWEYQVITAPEPEINQTLDVAGRNGWELVSFGLVKWEKPEQQPTLAFACILKRPRQS